MCDWRASGSLASQPRSGVLSEPTPTPRHPAGLAFHPPKPRRQNVLGSPHCRRSGPMGKVEPLTIIDDPSAWLARDYPDPAAHAYHLTPANLAELDAAVASASAAVAAGMEVQVRAPQKLVLQPVHCCFCGYRRTDWLDIQAPSSPAVCARRTRVSGWHQSTRMLVV